MIQDVRPFYILFLSTKHSRTTFPQVKLSLRKWFYFVHIVASASLHLYLANQCGLRNVTNVMWRHFRNSVWNLILIAFFKYSTGVPRATQEEKDFANFSIFDDPEEPYSSFKFHYDHKTFDRLHELMKFNTLLNVDLIKEKIASQVLRRWNNKEITLR